MENISLVDSDQLFQKIISLVVERIEQSSNYTPIPKEELVMCVEIIVVDAFMRCKIFKNPEGYLNATS
jgi:hypothetical protein